MAMQRIYLLSFSRSFSSPARACKNLKQGSVYLGLPHS